MRQSPGLTRTLIAATVVLTAAMSAACGGGGTASSAQPPAASAPAGAPTSAPAASEAAPSQAGQASGAPPDPGSGGTAADACGLVTVEEASGVIGGGAYTSAPIPGDPSYCTYTTAEGFIPLMTSLGQKDAKAGYDTWASASDSVKVSGVGDGALWVPTLATLLVLKGDRVLGITAGQGSDDDAKRQEWAKALALIAIARM